tara:strand:+ start:250 stop:576 length:327 start_codon:yes stop_codon:yes gene_type:complete
MKQTDKSFYQNTYPVSMDDLMAVWMETFHPFGTVLVIWDAKNHFEILQKCGILVDLTEAYNNKVITIELPSIMEAYELIDNIQDEGYSPFMQVYIDGKLISDNIAPIY